MNVHDFESVFFSDAALDLYATIAALTMAFLLLYWRSLDRTGRRPGIVTLTILALPVTCLILLVVFALPHPAINVQGRFRLSVTLCLLAALICYRIATPTMYRSFAFLDNRRSRVGIVLLFVGSSVATAYFFASRPAWDDDPFVDIESTEFISQGILFYPHDQLQFVFSFPSNLMVGEAGLVKVSAIERIGAGGRALIIPPGFVWPKLLAPDYDVTPVETLDHSTRFLIDRAPNNRVNAVSLYMQPIWYWIVRPKATGMHMLFVNLSYAQREVGKTSYSDARRFLLFEPAEYVRAVDEIDYSLSRDKFVEYGISKKLPVVIATAGARLNVISPFTSALTPWLALVSCLAGLYSILRGSRQKEEPIP